MTNCDRYASSLADYAEGRLEPAAARAVEQHLAQCAACEALVADLRSIRAAAFTLDRLTPPPDVWTRIQARLPEVQAAAPARVLGWPQRAGMMWLAAAAALMLAALVSLSPLLSGGDDTPAPVAEAGAPGDLVASVEADFQTAEAHYDKAILGLEQIAQSESEALDPQVAAVLQKNLQVVDLAIGESRAALRDQPTSQYAQESLFDALRTKVALLQQTVELINEMRKGNQAEAGRIVQGLNQ